MSQINRMGLVLLLGAAMVMLGDKSDPNLSSLVFVFFWVVGGILFLYEKENDDITD